MAKQGQVVAPVADLNERHRGKRRQATQRRDGQQPRTKGAGRNEVGDQPHERDEQADQRKIRVAIGHLLATDLHETDHRDERPQKPAPSDEEIGQPTYARNCGPAHGEQHGRGRADGQPRKRSARMRVVDDEVAGNERLFQIGGVGHEGVFDTDRERDRHQGLHAVPSLLSEHGHDREDDRDGEKRQLLE